MQEQATWYFDVISPFAYLALGEVEALAAGGLPVTFKPVLLGGILKHWGQLGPAEIAPKRLHTYRMCVWEAGQCDIPFRFPPAHPFNPLRLLRLVTALDATPAVVRTAMDLIWREGRDGAAEETYAALCQATGVADGEALIASTGAKDRLRLNTEEAIAAGVFGVPTLALGGELFWGADAMPLARAYLGDRALFTRGEMARVASLGEGVQRAR